MIPDTLLLADLFGAGARSARDCGVSGVWLPSSSQPPFINITGHHEQSQFQGWLASQGKGWEEGELAWGFQGHQSSGGFLAPCNAPPLTRPGGMDGEGQGLKLGALRSRLAAPVISQGSRLVWPAPEARQLSWHCQPDYA